MMHNMTPHVITSVRILRHRGPDETDIQHWQEHNINIILEWTTSLDTSSRTLFVCRGPGTGDCVQRDLSPTFLRRRHQRQTLAFL